MEHYLTTVLPFGARHSDALANLEMQLPARLAKNAKLHRELAYDRSKVLTEEFPGLLVPAVTLPLDGERLHELFSFVAKGLLWHHWAVTLQPHHAVKVMSLTMFGDVSFSAFLGMNANDRVCASLGNGAFTYDGVQGTDYPELSVWKVSVLGGLKVCGDPTAPYDEACGLGIVTAESQFFQRPGVAEIFG